MTTLAQDAPILADPAPTTIATLPGSIPSIDDGGNTTSNPTVTTPSTTANLDIPHLESTTSNLSIQSQRGRTIIPSTCADQLNKIGTKVKKAVGNVSPPEPYAQHGWMPLSPISPRASSVMNGSNTPVIKDAMEFGLATVKWWEEIQPSVRQTSASMMPVTIGQCAITDGNDIWESLQKGCKRAAPAVETSKKRYVPFTSLLSCNLIALLKAKAA
ncbi:hypothetical protein C0991_010263 [Blastosporella zonata]|nr:hypothetical protein C0991_010263 [Blastosporella zonata]